MSKKIGKVIKKTANVVTLGLSGAAEKLVVDPIKAGLGAVTGAAGMSAGGGIDRLAKTQIQIAQQQASTAASEAREQARASALQLQSDAEKQAMLAAAIENAAPQEKADVQLDTGDSEASARRKRFSSTSVGAGQGGPAIRI